MAYPPILPPTNRSDSTIAASAHPEDHNKAAAALAAIVAELGANPSGAYADLGQRLSAIVAGADPTAAAEFATALAGAEAARDAAVDISNIDTSDDVVETLLKGTAGAGPKTRGALEASYGHPRSTDGTDGLPVPDGVGLEFVITADGLQDIRMNGVSL